MLTCDKKEKMKYYNTIFFIVCLELFLQPEKQGPQLNRKYHSLNPNFKNIFRFEDLPSNFRLRFKQCYKLLYINF